MSYPSSGSVGSPDPTPACGAEGPLVSMTATTAAINGQRQPRTASYSCTFGRELGIRYT